MANTLVVRELVKGAPRFLYLLSGMIDTAEVDVIKVDISALPGVPSRIRINKIRYSCSGLAVHLKYDRSADGDAAMLVGTGVINDPIEDIGPDDQTGDLLLSTLDLEAGADGRGYTIEIEVEAKV